MNLGFGNLVVDLDQRRLFREGREVRLTAKAFELLRTLVEHRPKALSKEELFARLWPDTFVTENNLATLVGDLRAALDDSAHDPRFIRTIYGYGYAFAAEASETIKTPNAAVVPALSAWTLLHEDREVALYEGANILGRSGPGVVLLNSPTVSRHHARVSASGSQATVEDLGSKNGTWLGGTPVIHAVSMQDGDRLRLGSLVVIVRFTVHVPSTETVQLSRSEFHQNFTSF